MMVQELEDIAEIWDRLPILLGSAWYGLRDRLWTLLRATDNPDPLQSDAAVDEILTILVRYKSVLAALAETHRSTRSSKAGAAGELSPVGDMGPERYVSIKVFFGTDRRPTGSKDPQRAFAGKRGTGEIHVGEASVSIPDDHKMGALETPRWWKLEFRPNRSKHVTTFGLKVFHKQIFYDQVRRSLDDVDTREMLLFVHGFNVSFEDALRRTAQICYDLNFSGVPILYSWPSEGGSRRYAVDEGNIIWSGPHFRSFLTDLLCEARGGVMHLLAHSMGNRATAETLSRFDPRSLGLGASRVSQVMFAAPDVDAAHFTELVSDFVGRADRLTLYASSRDLALGVSQRIHKYPRAGDSGDGLVVARGVDTIDATGVATDLIGHSYYGENRSIISDVFVLVRHGFAPNERPGLEARVRGAESYWRFKP